jgi:hypothetical protein
MLEFPGQVLRALTRMLAASERIGDPAALRAVPFLCENSRPLPAIASFCTTIALQGTMNF